MKGPAGVVILAVLWCAPQVARAQLAPPSGSLPTGVPDAAEPCLSCHGHRGEGDPANAVPRIAGLPPLYSAKQIHSYAEGTRRDPRMETIARSLSPRDLAIVTAYFARLQPPAAVSATPTMQAHAERRGRQLALEGSNELRVPACNNCHGPDGRGEPPAIPPLAGQGANYLVAEMNAFRTGTRQNDAGEQMRVIARALSPEAIAALARYYSTLPPPAPAPFQVVQLPAGDGPLQFASTMPPAMPTIRTAPASIAIDSLPPADLRRADPERGRAILSSAVHGCAGCHEIPGVRRARGIVGPPLAGIARRGFIAGQLPNRADVLVAFLMDPPSLVPDTGMPDTGLTHEQALDVAAYLYTLRRQ